MERERPAFDGDALMREIRTSQDKKVFFLWSYPDQKFYVDTIKDFPTSGRVLGFENGNTYVFENGWICTLRWKNTVGIQNPAWKIGKRVSSSVLEIAPFPKKDEINS
jgi:hypothetical protein